MPGPFDLERFSQIISASPPVLTSDTVVGVQGGTHDAQYTMAQLTPVIGGLFPISGSKDFYVSTTGSDSNSGSISRPFATIQHAVIIAQGFNYGPLFQPTIHVADGTYVETQGVTVAALATTPTGEIIGNIAHPANVVVVSPVAGFIGMGIAVWSLHGFTIQTVNDRCIRAQQSFEWDTDDLILSGFVFYQVAAQGIIKVGQLNGLFGAQYNNMGASSEFIAGVQQGFFIYEGGPLNFPGAINFTFTVFFGGTATSIFFPFTTNVNMTGGNNVTGTRYNISDASILDAQQAGNRSQFPGNAVGSVSESAFIVQDPAYEIFTPLNGTTVNPTPGNHQIILNPSGGLSTLRVNLPTNMSDGESTTISTTQTITTLTFGTTDGSTIVNNQTLTLTWGSHATFMFDANNNSWYPSSSVLH